MQVLRLMGMPDRVIAFDSLPEDLVQGLEMRAAAGTAFRPWRDWMGKKKRVTKISPERDPFTNQIRVFEPIVEEDYYFYIVDETLNHDMEKWEAISDYVRRNAPKDFRLKDRIEDMALPLAPDVRSDVTLEPEQVVVIPLPKPEKPETAQIVSPTGQPFSKANPATRTLSDDDVKAMAHDKECKTLGRGARYSDGCAKCEALKLKREVATA